MSQITGIYKFNWFSWKVVSKKFRKLPKVTPFYGIYRLRKILSMGGHKPLRADLPGGRVAKQTNKQTNNQKQKPCTDWLKIRYFAPPLFFGQRFLCKFAPNLKK